MSTLIAVVLFVGVIAYALFGGADFGAGFWDLTAGGRRRGHRTRELINSSVSPVWEANHTWLVFCLVTIWTGFPQAFTAITTTLYLPLGLAALGIVARGAGFAFRHALADHPLERISGATFALSSVLTPFFFGTVAGGIASGRVPSAGHGDPLTSWLNPTSFLGGGLAITVCAYLAAVFLTGQARRDAHTAMEEAFRRRALGAGIFAGVVAVAGVFVLHADSPRLFRRLSGVGAPLLIISALCGLAALLLLRRGRPLVVRTLAAIAVAAVVAGWGVAQYPYLLGTHLTIGEGAAPTATLWVLFVVSCVAAALIVPSLFLLYTLQLRRRLG
ncbi:cytochrome D ubiquinol oxidase subunit II [Streptomyces sp. AS58]|uniref:Cytochrome d ubiquinol oxidase subunit II n=1 Tax=Streptomyces cadmiisoli TaxID=2184053 RepID=A0A2Z4ITA0_9ACTN|nr:MULTISPECIES: cytochrome d ubiquinol oxidase subunit II [Streptomyces]AWW35909.1 cytochrome d ubiquinol oxidase subunit II [Streptomyces cadmiisoli]KOV69888.1 cytochrome D ubiquinol oxidase subunit II [Streptomyces sp. AS58]